MPRTLPPFVAIDFETANRYPNSACSVALVRVERGRVADRLEHLIRPPFRTFEFTHIHHITWRHVQNAATFEELWPSVRGFLRGARFLAAHNAPFDRGVLASCCHWYGLAEPALPFVCSCVLARRTWSLARYDLATVASHLRIPLVHHQALSDAEACARILLAAHRSHGWYPAVGEAAA